MKTIKGIAFIVNILLVIFMLSCKKEKVNSPNYNKESYPSTISGTNYPGDNNNTYINGGSDSQYPSGDNGNTYPEQSDAQCLIGTWIIPSSLCYYGYHLQLSFFADGTGNAKHMDEYLCRVNMNVNFTWKLLGSGCLNIYFANGCRSLTHFSCPADELQIMWLNVNLKILVRG